MERSLSVWEKKKIEIDSIQISLEVGTQDLIM